MYRIRALVNKKPIRLIRWVSPLDRGLRGHSLDARFWISASPSRGFSACNLAPRSRDMNTRQSLLASEAWRVLALWQAFYVDLPRSKGYHGPKSEGSNVPSRGHFSRRSMDSTVCWDGSLQPACRVYVATTGGLLVTGGRQTNAPATTFYRNSRILFTTLSYEVGYIRRMASMCSSSTFMSALYGTPLQASRNSEP